MPDSISQWLPLLNNSLWFRHLPPALQQSLLQAAQLRQLQSNQLLFPRGEQSADLFAVLQGALCVGTLDAEGREVLLTVAEPVTWFGEIALFDAQPRTHDVRAAGPTTLLCIPQAALQQLLAEQPHWWREFALLLCHKLRLAFNNAEDLSLLPAGPRLARRLLLIARGYGDARTTQQQIRLTQERLAQMLSLSRQTTNQLLRELEQQGVLRLQPGCIEIVDLPALEQAASH
ncbi:Crp/Fnr family transcriptional regulator [Halopseudomonas yangmingensis]|uniref:cAMP-binding domain of CRP or a regulatory subunit of cAMP-dependent protein kinases n=1 Tax=Halopseudomonas yangmingensis TaxID=1720063 RepID=A0A1I4TES7_9GAMM|nr:Crp/Fnr family transcriptional regulator [Halopseudomonas yangmingensis]SFM75165.1 cAMP-binding domain of CRP or a regulatory subunit of cAMP-dependent protein kinases [Halopseudomonas yangmingensis]